MITAKTFQFLKDLKENNARQWFQDNRNRYEVAKQEMLAQMEVLIELLSVIDPAIGVVQPNKTLFRINRDTRFSKDKSPYKTNFGGVIAPGGNTKSPYGCYYLHVEPDSCFLAGGIYCPEPNILKNIREDIYGRTQEFKTIIENKQFKKYFSELWGEKLLRPPKGFPNDFPDVELLKYKNYTVVYEFQDDLLLDKQFASLAKDVFTALKPLNDFLNRAVNFALNENNK